MSKKMSVSAIRQVARLLHKQLDQKYYARCAELREEEESNQSHTNEAINKYLTAAAAKYGIENLVVLSVEKDSKWRRGINVKYTKHVQKKLDQIEKSCQVAYQKRREIYDANRRELDRKHHEGSDMIDGLALSLLVTDDVASVISNIEHFIQGM